MNRYEKIAGKLVEGKATELDKLRYIVTLAEGKIPAYQDAASIASEVGWAKNLLFNKRALLTTQIGAWNYRRIREVFDEWHRAWTEAAKAEEKLGEARKVAFEIGKKNPDLRDALEPIAGA
jgi:hypothetical protein